MKLLVDMNLSARWVEFFSSHGIDAKHWSDLGSAADSDDTIFAHARENDFVIFTHDLDFSAILSRTAANKPSVIQFRHDRPRVAEFGPIMLRIIAENRESLEAGALLLVEPHRHRIRILPITRGSDS
ncbi:MAG: DUF5615 family PIN-like protein [Opitutaceae bacterium]|nr:DUF5615 family PIN-like protein [Opitutaceae bacterium]